MPQENLTLNIKQLKAGTQYGEAQGVYECENLKLYIDVEGVKEDGNIIITEVELEKLFKRLRNITTNILEEVVKKTSDY